MARPTSKAINQKKHARRRAAARYAVNLHDDAQERIVRSIQSGEARLIRRQSQRVGVYEVSHEGKKLPVVYDRKRKTLITVLPEEALD